jgi:hypothetical protein
MEADTTDDDWPPPDLEEWWDEEWPRIVAEHHQDELKGLDCE